MLLSLRIQNIATIEDTTLDFHASSVALIGETGAGKSLIVNAVNLLLGKRADYSLLRDKSKKGVVSMVFSFPKEEKLRPAVEEVLGEDRLLEIKRTLQSDKSNRYYVNSHPISKESYDELTKHLISIHSQRDNFDLYEREAQLSYLDSFGTKIGKKKELYQKKDEEYLALKADLEAYQKSVGNIDPDYLKFQIEEIDRYHLKEHEIEDLKEEEQAIKEGAKVKDLYDHYLEVLHENPLPFDDQIGHVLHALQPLTKGPLKENAERLIDSLYQTQESLTDLKESYQNLDIDPYRIDEINARLYSLKGLMRKFGSTTESILEKRNEFASKLESLESYEEEVERRKKEIEEKEKELLQAGEELSKERKKAAEVLTREVGSQMESLGLRKDGFSIRFEECPFGPDGIDAVCYYVALNKGLGEEPLDKVASGGETSRLLLALQCVLNAYDPYDVLILDEIDTGVSGKQASQVGRKISELSKSSQTIVISHIPQVVSQMEQGILISKTIEGEKTFTKAKALEEDDFIRALAQLLSGEKITKSALEQAKELRIKR